MSAIPAVVPATSLLRACAEFEAGLGRVRKAIEQFADQDKPIEVLDPAATELGELRQIAGVLQFPGLALALEAMCTTLDHLRNGRAGDIEAAASALLGGCVQLGDYVEVVSGGRDDCVLVLQPLINELRLAAGQPLATESVLFVAQMAASGLSLPFTPPASTGESLAQLQARKLLPLFQAALLAHVKGQVDADVGLGRMGRVAEQIAVSTREPALHQLWRVFAAVIEALLGQGMDDAIELKRLMGACGQQLKLLAAAGESAAQAQVGNLSLQLLFFIGRSRAQGPRVQVLRRAFRLAAFLPPDAQLQELRSRLHGPNTALLNRVAEELHNDFRDVEDAVDLMVRTQQFGEHPAVAKRLRRLGSTLSTLGLTTLALAMNNQAAALEALPESPEDGPWMELATALLRCEHSLDQALFRQLHASHRPGEEAANEERIPHGEDLRRGRRALLRESLIDLARFKNLFDGLMRDPELSSRSDALRLLHEVTAALDVLGAARAVGLMAPLTAMLEPDTLQQLQRQPLLVDRFADAVTALDLLLEALRDDLHDVTARLEDFNRFVTALAPSGATEPVAAPVATPAPVTPAAPLADAADPEIRDIFLEEAEEVSATLAAAAARWGRQPDTGDTLVTIRRAFHTLKGSGRMAGAAWIGEFGWAVEHLLNQCLDGALEISPSIIDLVERAQVMLPDLIERFRTDQPPPALLEALIADARHLADGNERLETETVTVFRDDAVEKLDAVQQWLDGARYAQVPEDVVRAFHTLRGSASVAGVPAIAEISTVAESWLGALKGAELVPDDASHGLLIELLPVLQTWVGEAGTAAAAQQDPADWLERMRALQDALPAAATVSAADRELADIFSMEALTLVNRLEEQVAAWAQAPDRNGPAETIDKQLHTLAGAADMAKAATFAALTRALMERLRQRPAASLPGDRFFGDLKGIVEGFYQQLDAFRDGQLTAEAPVLMAQIERLDVLAERPLGEPEPLQPAALNPTSDTAVAPASTLPDIEGAEAPPAPVPAPPEDSVDVSSSFDDLVEPAGLIAAEADEGGGEIVEPVRSAESDASTTASDGADDVETAAEVDREAAFDAELQEIFIGEARELLEALDTVAQRWAREPSSAENMAEVKRILHTLKGSARVAGLTDLGAIAHHLESQLIELQGQAVPASVFARLSLVTDQLHGVLDALAAGDVVDTESVMADADLLQALPMVKPLTAMSSPPPSPDLAPTPTPAPRVMKASEVADTELLDIFAAEAAELMESIDAAMARWRQQPHESAPRRDVQRALHTLKGGARMSGWREMGDLAHGLETRLEALDDLPDMAATETLLQTVSGDVEQLHAQLDSLRAPVSRTAAVEAPAPIPTAAPEVVEPAPAPDTIVASPVANPGTWDPLLFWHPEDEQSGLAALRRETARVPVERLDGMLNEVGEISIYRSRLEEQVAGLGMQLSEMVQAIGRMRDQLRELGAETDAQINARGLVDTAPEQDRYAGDFDPLEMDRYTRMQELSRALSESVGDLGALHDSMDGLVSESESLLLQQGRISTEVQQHLMGTLMVPFGRQITRLERVVRNAAQETGKQVTLIVEGDEAELDRNVLERMTAPLEHLLRNAVVHGIEAPEQREAVGKPALGTVRIRLQREGSQLLLDLSDDGRGLDHDAIRETAIRRGLMHAEAVVTGDDLTAFIFEPGFSTARELTQDAGRGIGMDVVASEVKQLGGTLAVEARPGAGARFQVRLPLTLAISQALMVGVSGELYALPLGSIEGIVRIASEALDNHLREGGTPYLYGGQAYRVRYLGDYLGMARPNREASRTVHAVLIRTPEGPGAEARHTAMVVDQLLGNREIVSKAVGPLVSSVNGISSATILADGRVVLILDAPALVQARARRARVAQVLQSQDVDLRPLVLVVDDSITIRRVTERLLGRNGYRVATAKDGLDAMAQLQTLAPVAILLDIEMPRADGFEVATFIRNSERIRNVPIIMITSRSGEKHRARAQDIGVDRYLIKPYQEEQLMTELQDVLKDRGA